MKALITTVPFGANNRLPINLLKQSGIDYVINPFGTKLKESELFEIISDFDVIIAGTEPITDKIMSKGKKLKMISRVGIGLDSVDLQAAERRGINVSYTPNAPAPAVAELTIGMMLSLLRSVNICNTQMHAGRWHRYFGRRLSECTVGIIGAGRIGKRVIQHLAGFHPKKILVNDLRIEHEFDKNLFIEWCDKDKIYRNADIITIHIPLSIHTKNLIQREQLDLMKDDAIIINTSRGGIINEDDLYEIMKSGKLCGAALDVFNIEPYSGKLNQIERCLLTAHMGSMSVDCRARMEIESTEEAIRFIKGEELQSQVPKEEYLVQSEGL